ncbi:hypothetical protein Krad_2504 [Kineococcus radiotolerans SRS30216 = ATCC BAA-149]|uniref:Uncharacterized protein n=1 Tax=Kineococcus radiotolerans (strain ATCC BAA-149 / DSM 14245 / SRS30216) TaxID=266940 RepID=A6WAZ0_KINRD|nr:hypothetical protein Krad_2504 [Kineococcus radiotolerans SRS30216 = ATCC BAA-149]
MLGVASSPTLLLGRDRGLGDLPQMGGHHLGDQPLIHALVTSGQSAQSTSDMALSNKNSKGLLADEPIRSVRIPRFGQ